MKKLKYITSDNIELNGILAKNNSNTCVIMCHGIRSGKEEHGNFTKLAKNLNENNIDSFRFDFRGHGENNTDFSKVTIAGEIKDLEATIYNILNLGYKNIILLGASFGGGIVSLINTKKYEQIKGLILWYPCIVYKDTDLFCMENVRKSLKEGFLETKSTKTGKKFIFSKELMLQTTKYKPYDSLLNNLLPKLFIHGNNDKNVFYENIEKCANKCKNAKLFIIENGTHGFFDNEEHFKFVLNKTVEYVLSIVNK